MLTHIFALLGLSLLCALWVLFQRWLVRQDPDKKEVFRPGCGACSDKNCANRSEQMD